jgi:hypothetical protein
MKKVPLSALLAALCLFSSTARADVSTGLIAKYLFDGNAGDASGNGNHGSAVGSLQLTTDRFGSANAAYLFNGTNSYVLIPSSPSLNSPSSAMTQAAWILLNGPSLVGAGFDPIIMKSNGSDNAFMYRMNATTTYFGSAFNHWGTHLSAGRSIPLQEWHHVATVFNGTTIKFYFDGVLVDTQPMALTITPDNRALTIGADQPGVPEFFNGKIDDVHLYSRALSDADILELFSVPSAVDDASPTVPLAIGRPYPNPTYAQATIEFSLGSPEVVQLAIYDVLGRRIRLLRSESLEAGFHSATWNGQDDSNVPAPPGIYFFDLRAGNLSRTSRVVRLP